MCTLTRLTTSDRLRALLVMPAIAAGVELLPATTSMETQIEPFAFLSC